MNIATRWLESWLLRLFNELDYILVGVGIVTTRTRYQSYFIFDVNVSKGTVLIEIYFVIHVDNDKTNSYILYIPW